MFVLTKKKKICHVFSSFFLYLEEKGTKTLLEQNGLYKLEQGQTIIFYLHMKSNPLRAAYANSEYCI